MHELKARYFSIAHSLIAARCDNPEEVSHRELIRHPYAAAAEAERREALQQLLGHSAEQEAAEEAVLREATAVEARRKAEIEHAKAAGLPLPLYCRPAGRFPDLSAALSDVDASADPGGPELPTPRGVSLRPPPGVYVRGVHTQAMAQELVSYMPQPGGALRRDKKGSEAFNKRLDLAMEELGVRPPATATRAVCRAWYALRKELAAMMELRAMLSKRARDGPGAAMPMQLMAPPLPQQLTPLPAPLPQPAVAMEEPPAPAPAPAPAAQEAPKVEEPVAEEVEARRDSKRRPLKFEGEEVTPRPKQPRRGGR